MTEYRYDHSGEEVYPKTEETPYMTEKKQKLKGIFFGKHRFEEAGGEWDAGAMQWVDYWNDDDRNDPEILKPWVDMTLMVYSRSVGDFRLATAEDLRRYGWVWERA